MKDRTCLDCRFRNDQNLVQSSIATIKNMKHHVPFAWSKRYSSPTIGTIPLCERRVVVPKWEDHAILYTHRYAVWLTPGSELFTWFRWGTCAKLSLGVLYNHVANRFLWGWSRSIAKETLQTRTFSVLILRERGVVVMTFLKCWLIRRRVADKSDKCRFLIRWFFGAVFLGKCFAVLTCFIRTL